ncbi:MAG: DUF933 domain-containing protein [Candidatus Makana argininalis]
MLEQKLFLITILFFIKKKMKLKNQEKIRLEGKNYIIKYGDIVKFLFNK